MVKKRHDPIDLEQANKRLQEWRKKYDTPEKVAAQHRKKILDWVVESMAFEGEPVSKARLKELLKKEGRLSLHKNRPLSYNGLVLGKEGASYFS